MNQMKFYIYFSNLLSTFFLFIPEGKTQQMLGGEIDLSEEPFALCQCAYSLINDHCRKNYEKWTIINGTSIQGFDKSEEKTHQLEFSKLSLTRRVKLLKKGKFVVLNLKNGTLPSINFSPKDVIIFCSQSIHQEVQKIEITNIKEIIFLPEAITERNGSFEIHFQNIKKDLYLPTNLYNYDYKIADYDDSIISQTPLNGSFVNGTSIYIELYEVQGAYISSHSISAKSLLLKIDGAKFLTIEKTGVRISDPDPLFSGFILRNINRVKTECTWGSHLTVELCDKVYFEPYSLSESINTVFIANTNNMKTYEKSFLYGNPKFSVILNVQLWEIIGKDDILLTTENSSLIRRQNNSKTTIKHPCPKQHKS
ncbi:hypothetical protein Anas_11962 [Armadillidium nasatum]|uniref:Uncharacterized protein n=1 Tax=Armadillidium nasatum TaxID=96803 RepID=A0A5N5T7B3_9CRUS|nr:hypothetical protein Anas_11962 [Armadillidium nasatum]